MNIQELQTIYARLPQVAALAKEIEKSRSKTIFLEGLLASSAAMTFNALTKKTRQTMLLVLQDADEAGYFYHDLCQMMGKSSADGTSSQAESVLFFPSSYRRAIKYAQKDPASEILRTEVLTRLSSHLSPSTSYLYIVSFPEALAEMVVTRKNLDSRMLTLEQGQTVEVDEVCEKLRAFGFREVDYVYEPGQFALRGSILDVFSFSHEYPFRIDFFGDDIDSIRTFEVENQLSKERREKVDIVPEMANTEEKESVLTFLPKDTILVFKDYMYARDAVERTYQEGFSSQAIRERMEVATEIEQKEIEREMKRDSQLITGAQFASDAEPFRRIEFGHRPSGKPDAIIRFNVSVQPLFHKNFDLLTQTFEDYLLKGYKLYVLADSHKQIERLKDILAEKSSLTFEGVDKTLHEGFIDHDLRLCLFTDHQIFDRFHKYNLKSDKARGGKVALTLKEIQQFEIGDFVVHVDHGIGKFGGLVRMPITTPDGKPAFQEMIKIQYQRGDSIYVSIHSLYKVSKYKSQDNGEAPRMSTLGTGQWERLKERTKKQIKDIARDLIKLYAARRHQKGFAYSHDTYLQHELEASVLYENTPDQLKATHDVKADMESA
ncbi:MAG: transcription-repair coupling factor, partial [Bacteroidaceae bacterium]|nr:transcription-repair coupling factor [Bacteroidaceae bacterium]